MRMKPSLSVLAAGSLALLFAGCSSPAPSEPMAAPAVDAAALTATVQAMEDAYATAAAAKNMDAVMDYYADDVVSYGMHREAITGKAALRQDMESKMAKDTLGRTPTFKVIDVFAGNDHVTEIGSWTDTDKSGAVVDQGTYFAIFKKNGDIWQCVREISTSSKAKEEAAVAAAQP